MHVLLDVWCCLELPGFQPLTQPQHTSQPRSHALGPCTLVHDPHHNLSPCPLHALQVIVERADKSNIPDIDKKK